MWNYWTIWSHFSTRVNTNGSMCRHSPSLDLAPLFLQALSRCSNMDYGPVPDSFSPLTAKPTLSASFKAAMKRRTLSTLHATRVEKQRWRRCDCTAQRNTGQYCSPLGVKWCRVCGAIICENTPATLYSTFWKCHGITKRPCEMNGSVFELDLYKKTNAVVSGVFSGCTFTAAVSPQRHSHSLSPAASSRSPWPHALPVITLEHYNNLDYKWSTQGWGWLR